MLRDILDGARDTRFTSYNLALEGKRACLPEVSGECCQCRAQENLGGVLVARMCELRWETLEYHSGHVYSILPWECIF